MTRFDTLDNFDRKLLEILQVDCHRPVAAMAEAIGLSVPACYRRLRRLRRDGVIQREIAIVRPRTLGFSLTMIVLVMFEREGPHTMDETMRKLQAEPDVAEAWHVTGDFDFAVRIIARDMEGFDDLARRLFSADERIRSFKTLVVMREMKPLSPVPVALDHEGPRH